MSTSPNVPRNIQVAQRMIQYIKKLHSRNEDGHLDGKIAEYEENLVIVLAEAEVARLKGLKANRAAGGVVVDVPVGSFTLKSNNPEVGGEN